MPSITTASKRQLDLREFVSESNTEGYTALHFACEGGHDGVIDLLLRHGADREALTLVWSASPLHIAAKHGNLSSVELLVLYGSVIDIRDGKLRTPLHRYSMAILRNCPFRGKGGRGSLDVGITLNVVLFPFHPTSVPMSTGGSFAPMLLYCKQQALPLIKNSSLSLPVPSQQFISSSLTCALTNLIDLGGSHSSR